ncbi:MAG: 2-hydroxyacyl-CoA dehydratase [Clostridiales bacterium]|nr:2-hydroxyacyl-CoA dehydratase [Clostridiales bacterium]
MKDLKHLIYFEKLLENSSNELIDQARAEGKLAIGYTCFHMPEVLLNLGNCFSVRLRAPKTGSMDIATYYMSNYTCEYCRALLERSIEGGFNYLDALAGVDACAEMNRCMENIELVAGLPGEKFFVTHADIPYKAEDFTITHYVRQIRNRVLERLHEVYGVDISDESIRKAVAEHNEVCRIITELGQFRKLDNPPITGYEFHVLNMITYCCPKYLILDKLRKTLEEVKNRKVDAKPWFRARVAIVGSEVDDLDMTRLIEDSGAMVVADRFCFGSTPGREVIELNDTEDALTQVCRHYLQVSECPRFMSDEKIRQRRATADRLAREYNAEGIIFEQIKFCDFWAFERALASHIQETEYGHPVLSIDRPYNARSSGQLRTRMQAFVESLEIKRIQKNREGAASC